MPRPKPVVLREGYELVKPIEAIDKRAGINVDYAVFPNQDCKLFISHGQYKGKMNLLPVLQKTREAVPHFVLMNVPLDLLRSVGHVEVEENKETTCRQCPGCRTVQPLTMFRWQHSIHELCNTCRRGSERE